MLVKLFDRYGDLMTITTCHGSNTVAVKFFDGGRDDSDFTSVSMSLTTDDARELASFLIKAADEKDKVC